MINLDELDHMHEIGPYGWTCCFSMNFDMDEIGPYLKSHPLDEIDNMIDSKWLGWNWNTWMKLVHIIGIDNIYLLYWYRKKHEHLNNIDIK